MVAGTPLRSHHAKRVRAAQVHAAAAERRLTGRLPEALERGLAQVEAHLASKVFKHHPEASPTQVARAWGLEDPGFLYGDDEDMGDEP